jgi:hypothetical protein
MVLAGPDRIAGGIVTGEDGRRRTTGERDAERCKDPAQKNPTANHGCPLSFLSRAEVLNPLKFYI